MPFFKLFVKRFNRFNKKKPLKRILLRDVVNKSISIHCLNK